jgi:hypothetical protein
MEEKDSCLGPLALSQAARESGGLRAHPGWDREAVQDCNRGDTLSDSELKKIRHVDISQQNQVVCEELTGLKPSASQLPQEGKW